MTKINELKLKIVVTVLAIAVLLSISFYGFGKAYAQEREKESSTYGLFTSISIDVVGSNDSTGSYGTISGIATNKFTLGYSVIPVKVYLYSSETFVQYVDEMTLRGTAEIADLDINKTLTVSCSTEGKTQYWCAVVEYNQDNRGWVREESLIKKFDAYGNTTI